MTHTLKDELRAARAELDKATEAIEPLLDDLRSRRISFEEWRTQSEPGRQRRIELRDHFEDLLRHTDVTSITDDDLDALASEVTRYRDEHAEESAHSKSIAPSREASVRQHEDQARARIERELKEWESHLLQIQIEQERRIYATESARTRLATAAAEGLVDAAHAERLMSYFYRGEVGDDHE